VAAASHRVTMYSRRTCGLCDEAREVILAVRGEEGFAFEEVYVDGRDDLERDFGLRVPVVLVDGVEAFEISVDPARLRGLVSRGRLRD
jgi:glutaredoxin